MPLVIRIAFSIVLGPCAIGLKSGAILSSIRK